MTNFWHNNSISRGVTKGAPVAKEDSRNPLYLLYCIDCSGSMSEETMIYSEDGTAKYIPKIVQANEGFRLAGESINRFAKENVRFLPKWQVIPFSTYSNPLFPSFETVHDHSLTESQFTANGSTNIEALFNTVVSFLTKKHLGNYNRAVNIFLLSDGIPTDIDGWALSEDKYKRIVDKFKEYLEKNDLDRSVELYFITVGEAAEPFGKYFAGEEHCFRVEESQSIADVIDWVTRESLADVTSAPTNPIDFSDYDDDDEEFEDDDEDIDEDEESEELDDETDEFFEDEEDDEEPDESEEEEDNDDIDNAGSDDADNFEDDDDDGEGGTSIDSILKF